MFVLESSLPIFPATWYDAVILNRWVCLHHDSQSLWSRPSELLLKVVEAFKELSIVVLLRINLRKPFRHLSLKRLKIACYEGAIFIQHARVAMMIIVHGPVRLALLDSL